MSFFSSTPAGRVLNRFSSDLYTVDSSLPFILNIFLAQVFGVVGVIVVVCASLPLFLLFLIPLAAFYHRVQFYYRHTSREVIKDNLVSRESLKYDIVYVVVVHFLLASYSFKLSLTYPSLLSIKIRQT